jgi:hypothetical protein
MLDAALCRRDSDDITLMLAHRAFSSGLPLGKERRHVVDLLRGFDHEHCEAWDALSRLFGTGVRHKEWYSFGMVVAHHVRLPRPSRTTSRSLPALIMWFQQNWPHIEPQISTFHFLDAGDRGIDRDRQVRETGGGWRSGIGNVIPVKSLT